MRRHRLTPKQRKAIQVIARDPDATLSEIGVKAGYTSPQHVVRALASPAVKAVMETDKRLKARALVRKLAEGLDAKETKFFSDKGIVTDKRDFIDYQTRHKYLETALRLRGDLSNKPPESEDFSAKIINQIFLSLQAAEAKGIIPPSPKTPIADE